MEIIPSNTANLHVSTNTVKGDFPKNTSQPIFCISPEVPKFRPYRVDGWRRAARLRNELPSAVAEQTLHRQLKGKGVHIFLRERVRVGDSPRVASGDLLYCRVIKVHTS
ncbi:hypothetical protein EVAR_72299_1 [Eumeta japonica]|uniref:Uncharacterized protein n=1 Tax=Eumeta variegata TaxID=151549 RepID=A0A4C1TFY2_EUMVA|nr:hypothetical protein EVAR_72299_1 [Eumeta japonica]